MQNSTLLDTVLKNLSFILLLSLSLTTLAESIEAKNFNNNQQYKRYHSLINEIRCPVCQGQSIADSNAALAKDLREKVRTLILAKHTDLEIQQFMTNRYGDFAVFKPPMNKNTYLLWFTPFVFLGLGLFFFIRSLSNKNTVKAKKINTVETKDLLKD